MKDSFPKKLTSYLPRLAPASPMNRGESGKAGKLSRRRGIPQQTISDNNQGAGQARGFTLFETLVAIGIFLLATLAIAEFIRQSYQIQQFSFESEQIISSAQRGVETMVKEVRELLPSAAGAYPVEKADQNELIFFADYDRDNFVERIRYFISGNEFKKGVVEPTGSPISYPPGNEVVSVISQGVRNAENLVPLFQYYNGDWPGDVVNNPLAVPANPTLVRLVRIDLRINILPNKAPKEYQLVSEVTIRNLKENL